MVPVDPILFGKLSQKPAHVNVVETIEGPQIKSFHSTSFCYHVDEKKKEIPGRAPVYVEFALLPCLPTFSPGIPVFSHIPVNNHV